MYVFPDFHCIYIKNSNNKKMKRLLLASIALTLMVPAQAQEKITERTITVTGAAEKEVVPDEIHVNFEMDAAKSKTGFDLDSTRAEFSNAADKAGIRRDNISVAGYDFFDTEWYRWRHIRPEQETAVTFSVKFDNSSQINKFIGMLNKKRIRNIYIAKTAYSKATELRRELKIMAVKAAKEKAMYLAEAVDEKIGKAQTIREINNNDLPFNPYVQSQYSNKMAEANEQTQNTDFKKIKLRFEMEAVFLIQ